MTSSMVLASGKLDFVRENIRGYPVRSEQKHSCECFLG